MNDVLKFVKKYSQSTTGRICVYTVLFGDYDKLQDTKKEKDIDYFLFTDGVACSVGVWNVINVDGSLFGGQRTGRYLKCLGHLLFPDSKNVIYMDSSFKIICSLNKFISDNSNVKFGLFLHGQRSDAYEEAVACLLQNKDDSKIIEEQISRYELDGFPRNSGCYATGFLLRDFTNISVIDLNTKWFVEIYKGSVRDQISLPYIIWKIKYKPNLFHGDVFFNNYAIPLPHKDVSIYIKIKRFMGLSLHFLRLLKK